MGGEEEPKEENMTEYCKQLETWLWKAYTQRTLATSAYFTALNSYYASGATGIPAPGPAAGDNNANYLGPQPPPPQQQPQQRRIFGAQRPLLMFMAAGGMNQGQPGVGGGTTPGVTVSSAVVVKIAPVWKRVLAECIDFVFLLVVKLFITFTIIDSFELIDLDNLDLETLRAEAAAGGDSAQLQSLYDIAFSLTSELLLLELTHRIVVCFFEGYCLWKVGGTPGKTLLGLRVVYAEDVLPFTPAPRGNNGAQGPQIPWDQSGQAVIVRPGCFLNFPRAFARSALKNFSLAFFFPLCFTLFHFDNSRTLYDLMAKSIVIEIH